MSGIILTLQGPSGVGKSTLAREIKTKEERAVSSVSITTRPMRTGEVEGVDYCFTDETRFGDLIRTGQLAEWTSYCGNHYGTLRDQVDRLLADDRIVLTELDAVGARRFKKVWGKRCISTLILPPSWEELERRLHGRGTDTEEVIQKRLHSAVSEVRDGLRSADYALVNEHLWYSLAALLLIVRRHVATPESDELHNAIAAITGHWRNGNLGLQHFLARHLRERT